MATTRVEFRELAAGRLAEAKVLAEAGYPSGAYYLAGYVIECALKAIIAAKFRADEIPDKRFVSDTYTHKLPELLRLSELEAELQEADPELVRSWDIVKRWSESARYVSCDGATAATMLEAIGTGDEGLFGWLTSRW